LGGEVGRKCGSEGGKAARLLRERVAVAVATTVVVVVVVVVAVAAAAAVRAEGEGDYNAREKQRGAAKPDSIHASQETKCRSAISLNAY
jgi:hypothetical protein